MASPEQVKQILEKMEKVYPEELFKKMDETQAGIGAVLRLLHKSEETVTAGKISEVLGISTARVAVLLKKMVAKNLIVKERGEADARVITVKLTETGRKAIADIESKIYAQTAHVIDVVGEERVLEFIAILTEIKAAFKQPHFEF